MLPSHVKLLKTEIRTGRMFAHLADSDDPKRKARNTANARKAFDAARDWVERAFLSAEDSKEVADQLDLLKADLAKLEMSSKRSR